MARTDLIMPKMGESIMEATILKWLKKEGENVALDEPLLEIATDKVDSEVPSPAAGILKKTLFNEGDVVQVGAVFAIIGSDLEPEKTEDDTANKDEEPEASKIDVPNEILKPLTDGNTKSIFENNNENFYSPLVKSIASKEGISINDLNAVSGTGVNGRVTKKDILSFLDQRDKGIINISSSSKKTELTQLSHKGNVPDIPISNNDEIIESATVQW